MKKKTNNKGFSLVELIVVIAIMAVLIGVLAPQYLKYVERSRKSADKQNVDAIINALQIYATDPDVGTGDTLAATGKVTISTTSAAVSSTNATGNSDKALTSAGIKTLVLKSSKWSATTIDVNFTITGDGTLTVTATDATILQ